MKLVTKISLTAFSLAVVCGADVALAAPQPQLYPNSYLQQVGPDAAKRDVAECQGAAQSYENENAGENRKDRRRSALRAGAKGAAAGALAGTITGNNVGRSTGAGAAIGASASVLKTGKEKRQGTPEYRTYVESCLEDKGYKVLSWK